MREVNGKNMLLVGLGNPGIRYEKTRHNAGFMVLDEIAAHERLTFAPQKKFSADMALWRTPSTRVWLVKPTTMMNCSGRSVQPLAHFYNIDVADILVVHDDLDLDFGDVRLKIGGGFGGHNGLKSIGQSLGTPDFVRLRIGIGRPSIDVISYVLQAFSTTESNDLQDILITARLAVDGVVQKGAALTMNSINGQFKAKQRSLR